MDGAIKSLSVEASALDADDSVILGLGDAMEDDELFEDVDGPDLSLERHIANVKCTKD